MLGAYFYGYAAGMPLAGWWSTKFGPRMTTGKIFLLLTCQPQIKIEVSQWLSEQF